jgi:hypothetical protein
MQIAEILLLQRSTIKQTIPISSSFIHQNKLIPDLGEQYLRLAFERIEKKVHTVTFNNILEDKEVIFVL